MSEVFHSFDPESEGIQSAIGTTYFSLVSSEFVNSTSSLSQA